MRKASRGDLLVTYSIEAADGFRTATQRTTFHLAVVAGVSREREIVRARRITGLATDSAYITAKQLTPILQPSGAWSRPVALELLPAAELRVADAIAAITAQRGKPGEILLSPYASPQELARDLAPWRKDGHNLGELRSAAYRFLQEDDDMRCARCGVTCRDRARIEFDDDDCPIAVCDPACPTGVNFTTSYPLGTKVQITTGFAAGAIAAVERVSDSFVNEPYLPDEPPVYVGRSYVVDLAHWGRRPMTEEIIRPVDEDLVDRHAVRRPASPIES